MEYLGGTAWFLFLGWGVSSLNTILHPPIINISAVLLFFTSAILILKYAPGETENKPITSEAERKKYKKWSVSIMITYGFIIVLFSNLEVLNTFVLPIAVGIIAQAFTVSPAGYGFIHFIDRVLDFSNG